MDVIKYAVECDSLYSRFLYDMYSTWIYSMAFVQSCVSSLWANPIHSK